ncbi:hypothetical protein [Roseobacter sp. GAI101]|uniref:hypothetical protein n=1 Tax=Roseobacter sp. (strain GAI101) TaxID=391589 RepID=UPI0005651A89|nr:hypothetical protein [Roseobacter sp. GAI101]
MPIKSLQFNGVNYRRFSAPFSLDELYRLNLTDASRPEKNAGFYQPLIEDYTDVNLITLESSDIIGHLTRIRNAAGIPRSIMNNYVTCVAGDLGSYGMLRMYGVYAEIYGVREEEKFYVAESLLEATTWLMFKKGLCSNEAVEATNFFAKAA